MVLDPTWGGSLTAVTPVVKAEVLAWTTEVKTTLEGIAGGSEAVDAGAFTPTAVRCDNALKIYNSYTQSGAVTFTLDVANSTINGGVVRVPFTSDGSAITWSSNMVDGRSGLNADLPATLPVGTQQLAFQYDEENSRAWVFRAWVEADQVAYNPTVSGLAGTTVKDAIDEVAGSSAGLIQGPVDYLPKNQNSSIDLSNPANIRCWRFGADWSATFTVTLNNLPPARSYIRFSNNSGHLQWLANGAGSPCDFPVGFDPFPVHKGATVDLIVSTNVSNAGRLVKFEKGQEQSSERFLPFGGTTGQVPTKGSAGDHHWVLAEKLGLSTDAGNQLTADSKLWVGTQISYDAIPSPDAQTLYIIV